MTSRIVDGNAYILTYDAENRLVDVSRDGVSVASFVYDGNGQRVQSTVNPLSGSGQARDHQLRRQLVRVEERGHGYGVYTNDRMGCAPRFFGADAPQNDRGTGVFTQSFTEISRSDTEFFSLCALCVLSGSLCSGGCAFVICVSPET